MKEGQHASQWPTLEIAGSNKTVMAIYRMLRDQRIGLERASVLAAAYELTLRALTVKDRNDPVTKSIAEKIIQIGQRGGHDPNQISKLAIKELGH
jgi:hypothetical protein